MYLGLDLSLSSSGAVIIDSTYNILQKEIFSTSSIGVERLFFLEKLFLKFLKKYINIVHLVCIESPAYGISDGNLFQLGQWAGLVELTLYKYGKNYIFASPSQLKKYILGSGKGAKQLMLLKTYQNFNEEFNDDNLCDAYGLARIAHDYNYIVERHEDISLKKYQNEVIDKIYNSKIKLDVGRLL